MIELTVLSSSVNYPAATHKIGELLDCVKGENVSFYGFIDGTRKPSKHILFLTIIGYSPGPVYSGQVISEIKPDSTPEHKDQHKLLGKLPLLTPLYIEGTLASHSKYQDAKGKIRTRPEVHIHNYTVLNNVSPDIMYVKEKTGHTIFPPEKRHLQLRTDRKLYYSLRARSRAMIICRQELEDAGFMEVETPLLFKSTPEGAREFLVPSRNKDNNGGMCYALPQSPQQYKQMLMASGINKYYQFAKCFRDEDLRADRQPEFTQLDMEMAFARQEDVIEIVERIVKRLWSTIVGYGGLDNYDFPRMRYVEAMTKYGSDKPDLRHSQTLET